MSNLRLFDEISVNNKIVPVTFSIISFKVTDQIFITIIRSHIINSKVFQIILRFYIKIYYLF